MTAPSFTEFCCRSGGSNLNAGTRTGSTTEPGTSADFTYTSGTWVSTTRVFTVGSGNPLSDGVAVGDRVSVYPDGTTPDGVYFGKVSARDATTITVSSSDKFGTAPTDGSSTRTLKVGGAWKGPNGTSGFPFNIIQANTPTLYPRINLKNDQTYSVTANISYPNGGESKTQAYTTAYGDLGKATIDGGTSGVSYTVFSPRGNNQITADIIFQNNGATGTAALVDGGGAQITGVRCVFRHSCGTGVTGYAFGLEECEAYDCNQNNGANLGGVISCGWVVNTVSHHNAGSNTIGIGTSNCYRCISATNGGIGFNNCTTFQCCSYNNTSDGFRIGGVLFYLENCNSLKNGGWGYNFQSTSIGTISELRYGAGTQANTSGGITIGATAAVEVLGTQSAYPADVTPWADPANGDFRLVRPEAIATGRGAYTSIGGISGTVGYPDIGAAQARVMFRARRGMNG